VNDDKGVTMKDKLDVLRNDQKVRDSFHSRAMSDVALELQGRFAASNTAQVAGTTPSTSYPRLPANSPWASPDPVPVEPPTGCRVDEMDAVGEPFEILASSQAASNDDAGTATTLSPEQVRGRAFLRRL